MDADLQVAHGFGGCLDLYPRVAPHEQQVGQLAEALDQSSRTGTASRLAGALCAWSRFKSPICLGGEAGPLRISVNLHAKFGSADTRDWRLCSDLGRSAPVAGLTVSAASRSFGRR